MNVSPAGFLFADHLGNPGIHLADEGNISSVFTLRLFIAFRHARSLTPFFDSCSKRSSNAVFEFFSINSPGP